MSFERNRPRCCADCGMTILVDGQREQPEYRRLHFRLIGNRPPDPNVTFVSFCQACAVKPWTRERLDALEAMLKRDWAREVSTMTSPSREQMAAWYDSIQVAGLDARYPVQTWAEVI